MAVVGKASLVASFAEAVASCLVTAFPILHTPLAVVGTSVTAVVGTLVVPARASFAVADTLVATEASLVRVVTLLSPSLEVPMQEVAYEALYPARMCLVLASLNSTSS